MTKKRYVKYWNEKPFDPFHPPICMLISPQQIYPQLGNDFLYTVGKVSALQLLFIMLQYGCMYCAKVTDPDVRLDSSFAHCRYCSGPFCVHHFKDIAPDRWRGKRFEDMINYIDTAQLQSAYCRACRNPNVNKRAV